MGREERAEVQRRAEQQEQELARLESELRHSQTRADARDQGGKSHASRSWKRRLPLAGGLLLGALIAWFTSLVVALNVLAP